MTAGNYHLAEEAIYKQVSLKCLFYPLAFSDFITLFKVERKMVIIL